MNIIKLFFRDRQETSVDIFEAWEVRWRSRHGEFSSCTRPEIRIFTSKEGADEFGGALKDAFALVKQTSGTRITISKQKP